MIRRLTARLFVVAYAVGAWTAPARAATQELAYAGRLTAADGSPLAGPVDLSVAFFGDASGGSPLRSTPLTLKAVGLTQGVFQIDLGLSPAEVQGLFASGAVYVEVTDVTHGKVYPRQRFGAVPYALAVPTDGTSVVFDPSGALSVAAVDQGKVTGLAAALAGKADVAQTLTGDLGGNLSAPVVAKLQGQTLAAAAPSAGQVLTFAGGVWAPATPAVGSGSAGASLTASSSVVIASLALGTPSATSVLDLAGAVTARGVAAPGASTPGQGRLYFDQSAGRFLVSENGGGYAPLVGSGGSATTVATGTGLTGGPFSGSGTVSLATFGAAGTYTKVTTDATGRVQSGSSLAAGDIPAHSAALLTSGTLAAGVVPPLSALSGTLTAGQLPALTAGMVSGTFGAGQIPALDAGKITTGTFSVAQLPGLTAGMVSGTFGAGQIPALDAGKITTGTFGAAQLPSLTAGMISGTFGAAQIPALDAGKITTGTFSVAQLPSLDASQITSGTLAPAQLPPLSEAQITTGTLAVTLGGTGATSFAANGVVVGAGAGPLSATAAGSNYQVLTVTGGLPGFGAVNLGQGAAVTGTLPVANGGTGSNAALTGSRLVVSSGSALVEAPSLSLVGGNLGVGTTSAGSALDVAGVFSQRATSAPAVAPGGQGRLYFDATSNQFMVSQNGGAYAPLGTASAVSQVSAGAGLTGGGSAGNVTLALDTVGTAGTYAKVLTDAYGRVTAGGTLAAADLPPHSAALLTSGTLSVAQVPLLSAAQVTSGTFAPAQIPVLPASQVSGTFAAAQIPVLPASQVSGTFAAAQIPILPAAQINGTFAAAQIPILPASQINGTFAAAQIPVLPAAQINGTFAAAQIPAIPASQVSGTFAAAQIPTLPASQISGTFAVAQIPMLPASQISGTFAAAQVSGTFAAAQIPALDAAKLATGTLALAQLPFLPASQITTGTLALAQIPPLPATQVSSGTLALAQIPLLPAAQLSGTLATTQLPALSEAQITSGTLAVALGGTGATSFASNGVVVGGGAGPLSATAAGAQYQVLTVNGSNQPIFGALNLGQAAGISGTLPVANGGTGSGTALAGSRLMLSSGTAIVEAPALTNGQLLIGSSGAAPAVSTLSPGATQGVTVTVGAGTLTLDTAQDIRTSATPLFTGLRLSGPTPGSLVKVGSGGTLVPAVAGDVTGLVGSAYVSKSGDTVTGNLLLSGAATLGIGTTSASSPLTVNGVVESKSGGFKFPDGSVLTTATAGSSVSVFTTCTNAQSADSANAPCYGAAANTGQGNATYRAVSCQAPSGYLGGTLQFSGGVWIFWGGSWASCVDGTLRVVNLAATGGTYTTQWSAATGGINFASGSVGIGTSSPETTLDVAGAFTERGGASPGVAPAGQGRLYFDAAANQFLVSQNGGAFVALATGSPLTGVTAGTGLAGGGATGAVTLALATAGTAGAYAKVQTDAYGRVTGGTTLSAADLPPHSAALVTSGTLAVAQLPAIPVTQLTGTLTAAQLPSVPVTQLTGTLTASQLPPLSSSQITSGTLAVALGGTGATSFTNNGVLIGAGSGPLSATTAGSNGQVLTVTGGMPGFGALNLGSAASVTGTLALAQLPLIPASQLSGTLATAQLPALAVGQINSGTLAVAQIPGLPASQVTSGTFSLAQIPTGVVNWAAPGAIGSSTPNSGAFTTLTTSGNVGIGTTSPNAKLSLANNVAVMPVDSYGKYQLLLYDSGTPATSYGLGVESGYTWLNSGSSGFKFFVGGAATPDVIFKSGTVGIGTSSPGTALDVVGALTERGVTAPAVAPAGQGRLYFDSGSNQFLVSQNGAAYTPLSLGGLSGITAGTGLTGGGATGAVTVALAATGTAGAYAKVQTDAYGRVTGGTTLSAADLPPHSAALVTSGTLAVAQLPSIPTSQLTGTLSAAQVASIPASQVTGTLAVANGGTGASTAAGARTALAAAGSGANGDITSLTGLTTALPLSEGGTGATSASAARTALAAAGSGANGDITSLTGLTTALPLSEGGTGATSASAARTALAAAGSGANGDITSLTGLTTALPLSEGDTGATSASAARTALAAAGSGANGDITSLTGLTTALPVSEGGTGATTLTANAVLVGNGTGAPLGVAPSTSGNVLTSNGTSWVSQASAVTNWASPGAIGSSTPNTAVFTSLSVPGGAGSEKLGAGATASGTNSTAVGNAATTSNVTQAVAVGNGATANTANSVAIGYAATAAGNAQAIVLGSGAAATAANQLIVGSTNTQVTDGYFGTGVASNYAGIFTLHSSGQVGTNITGRALGLAGGQGTGTGDGGPLIFQTAPAGTTGSALNPLAEAMRITGSGQVGIGTTVPTSSLTVVGASSAAGYNLMRLSNNLANAAANTEAGVEFYAAYTGNGASPPQPVGRIYGMGAPLFANGRLTLQSVQPGPVYVDTLTVQNGRVGIGTTSPSQLLDVVGATTPTVAVYDSGTTTVGKGGELLLQHNNGSSARTSYASVKGYAISGGAGAETGALVLKTMKAGTLTEQVRIDNNGYVGIGTAAPTALLSVKERIGIDTPTNGTWSAFPNPGLLFVSAGGGPAMMSPGAEITSTMQGSLGADLQFVTRSASGANAVEVMRIASTGNVGLGTTSPSQTLHLYTSGATTNTFANFQNGTRSWIVGTNGGLTSSMFNIYDSTAGQHRLVIDSSGNFGIGTTVPGQKLSVAGTVESTSGGFKYPDGSTQTSGVHKAYVTNNGTTCAVASQDGSWISSVSRSSTGVCVLTITASTFATTPVCVCTPGPTASWKDNCSFSALSAGSVTVYMGNYGLNNVNDDNFNIMCQ